MIIAISDLLEAEGRDLRKAALRTGIGLVCLWVAACLFLAGLGFCLWAAYQGLAIFWGPLTAAVVSGLIMLFMAGLLAWISIRLNR